MSNNTLLGLYTSVKCHSLSLDNLHSSISKQSSNRICFLTVLSPSRTEEEEEEMFVENICVMIDISFTSDDTLPDIIRLSSPPCMQVRVSDNMDGYIYATRIRPIGYGLGISEIRRRRRRRNLNYRVCPINTYIICTRGRAKVKERKKKKLTIIASLSRFYYIVHRITTTLVYVGSLINIADIERVLAT